jgi:hypothetical protein
LSLSTRFHRSPTAPSTIPEDDASNPDSGGHDAPEAPSPDAPANQETPGQIDADRPDRTWRRTLAGGALTALAVLLVLLALLLPDRLPRLDAGGLLRLPIEGLVIVGLFLVLPARAGRVLAVLIGLGLGLLTIVKLLDMGFNQTLDRPFDPMVDFPLAGNGLDYIKDSNGEAASIAVAVGIVVAIVLVLVLMTLAVRRLARSVTAHRTAAGRAVVVLSVVWVVLAVLGTQIVPATPLASRHAAALTYRHLRQIPDDLEDSREFTKESAVDAFRNTPGDQLLTGLRGKDVIVSFVESYGRSALENPELAPQIDDLLDRGSQSLKQKGFASRSGWLTSPTAGGGSWLAQSTLLSGLWIKNQKRYDRFVASDRLTLNGAFGRADWRTLAVAPGIKQDWPEARVFGFDKIYAARTLGYQGPKFSWSWMPDQYVLSHFQKTEHAPEDRAPLMAEIPLTSSHMPWTPLPSMVDWDDVGDGTIFEPMAVKTAASGSLYSNPTQVRARYREAIKYSLTTLISYVETYGDDNLVLVFLGDHQPFPTVTGENPSHDVPITIVARDPAVLEQISDWNWEDGLNPSPRAPVWPMSDFRNRFLTAFGPQGSAGSAATPSSSPGVSPGPSTPSPTR